MEQIKALNALEPFLALTKSASSPRAAADLITRATSHPNTFIFAELLQAPQIQALSSAPEQASSLALLKIFSYGIYTDYQSTPNLPPLNEQQILKLRQLSFLTLAKDPKNLSYANILRELGLETPRELEDLVISAIYAGLVSGTLDPYNQVVNLSSVSPLRDLPPDSIPSMLNTLSAWSSRCIFTLAELEKQIANVKADALKRHCDEQEWAATVEKLTETKVSDKNPSHRQSSQGDIFSHFNKKLGAGAASKRGNGGLDREDSDDMDVDDDEEDSHEQRGTRAKKRGFSNLSFGK